MSHFMKSHSLLFGQKRLEFFFEFVGFFLRPELLRFNSETPGMKKAKLKEIQ